MTKYFGDYGIRGTVGQSHITPSFFLRLGFAIGARLISRQPTACRSDGRHRPTVLIGKDTRISGYMLESALESGFAATGVDVMLVGPMPTPAVAFLTRALRLELGIVITASHNRFSENGLKIFSGEGSKLDQGFELEIEAQLAHPMKCVASADLGKAYRIPDAAGRYIEFCKRSFPTNLNLGNLKIVVDCAHGATYHIAPAVLHELGAEVISLGVAPDGFNINDGVGSTSPEALRREVVNTRADIGIGLDGDGDRVVMVGADGHIYDGDMLLYVIAKGRLGVGVADAVVGTINSNRGVEEALRRVSISLIRSDVGDRHILEAMTLNSCQLGGEDSGHIVCREHHSTSDGIIAALQVLSVLQRSGLTIAQACADVTEFPKSTFSFAIAEAFDWTDDPVLQEILQQARNKSPHVRIVVRRSGSEESILRVMVEGPGLEVAEWAQRIGQVFKNRLSS